MQLSPLLIQSDPNSKVYDQGAGAAAGIIAGVVGAGVAGAAGAVVAGAVASPAAGAGGTDGSRIRGEFGATGLATVDGWLGVP